jgi:rhamnosyltransferase
LLDSPGYAANVVGLFQKEAGLGAAYPPMIHIGYPTLGGAWFSNKEPAQELYDRVGIHVPLDDLSPLAPFGSMFIARPEALAILTSMPLTYDDFPREGEYTDGTLAHVLERSVSYAAGELGFHTRTVANPAYAAISHTFLEYKLDQLSKTVRGPLVDEINPLRRRESYGKLLETGNWFTYQRVYLARRHPRLMSVLRRVLRRNTQAR